MRILFWDIDGTLIKTARAGIHAFEHATKDLFNQIADFDTIPTSGRTDCFLAEQAIQTITKKPATTELINCVITGYEAVLRQKLSEYPGFVLPNVKEILAELEHNNNFVSLLLTGNSLEAAKIKMQHFGLYEYFKFEQSAFGNFCTERNGIAANALASVRKHYPDTSLEDILIIGDTPHDIGCANSIKVKTLAVATGRYSLKELCSHYPWKAVEQLPPPSEFIKLVSQ